ncbi:hypothetical protein IV203_028541 [Nitzschia inconspicua]|uniref:Uncharacterized protein n=1 Tax=Nitzschia inconspicua TaxID=303405 RepID=A0A9K3LS03_9STRA|nr:hypothetical protein IV203_028541 [Nitzschia inconspicua]
MYGPRWNHNGKRTTQMSPPGHILIPPFNPLPEFQLSVVSSNQKQTQPVPLQEDRKYSFVSAAPSLNKKMGSGGSKSSRIFRKLLYNIPLQQQQQQQTIGGLPYIASEI